MKVTEKNFFVLLADLRQSQKIKDREAGTQRLKEAITSFNAGFAEDIYAPMEITRGDEAASVLKSICSLYDALSSFTALLKPFNARFAVTYGVLTAGLSGRRSTEIDGPAFYEADRCMDELKKSRNIFRIETGNHPLDESITSLMNMTLLRESDLTPFQLRIIQLYGKDYTQNDIARRVKRTQQQVQQIIKVAPFDALEDAGKTLRTLLQTLELKIKKGGR